MDEKDKIESDLLLLDEYRKNIEIAKQIKKNFEEELNSNPKYSECCKMISDLGKEVDLVTERIKIRSVEVYLKLLLSDPCPDKSMICGNVKIQEKTRAEIIDKNAAYDWAVHNAQKMLVLDEKEVLKHAIAVSKTLPLPFVKIKEEFVATIASEIKF